MTAQVVPLNASVAEILEAVKASQTVAAIEGETPQPPIGSSDKAQALWYGILRDYELSLTEMVLLEQIANTQTALDEVEDAWRRDGAETTSTGSMGQSVVEPRIQEMRQLRSQMASLIKSLNLPKEDEAGGVRRRPGRPTRSENPNQGWH